MMFGVIHASFSLPEWEALKMTFFALSFNNGLCHYYTIILSSKMTYQSKQASWHSPSEKKNNNNKLLSLFQSRISFFCFGHNALSKLF